MCEFGQLPVLEIDGLTISGSRPIARYIAMKQGFYPTNPKEIYEVESASDYIEAIYNDTITNIALGTNTEDVTKYFDEVMMGKLD
jgi:glutathione S-transferase